MSALQIKVLPRNTTFPTDAVARGLAAFLFVGSILIVLFAGTFPFDFSAPAGSLAQQVQRKFDWNPNPWDPGFVDRTENLLFFLPFGFAFASVIRARRMRRVIQIVGAAVLSLILSSIVEVAQAFVSFRDPSFADVWCNTLGGVLGAVLFIFVGETTLRYAAKGLLRLRPLAKPPVLGAALVVYSLLHLSAPLLVHNAGDLSVWDTGMPLVVGNELTGDRPWSGIVSQVVLADRAATGDEAMQLARGAEPADVFNNALLAHYRIKGPGPYPDLAKRLKPLLWNHESPEMIGDSAPVHDGQWLATSGTIAPAIYRIMQTSQFTLATVAESGSPDQHGPARIVGISTNVHNRDVQITQDDGPDLAVRVRTAVRSMPDLYLANVFGDTYAHQILVTAKAGVIVIYVDGNEQGRCEVTPEAKVIWRLYPRNGFRLRIERYGFRSYAAIYRLLVFIPFAALLGAALAVSSLPVTTKRWIGVGAIVAMVIALEIVLGTQSASGVQIRNLLISLIVAFTTLGILAWSRRARRSRIG